jgi:hypothetical protein
VTIDPLAVAIDARGVAGASLGLPCASLEVIDRCQRVPGAAKVEMCAAQSDIFGAVPTPSAALAPTGAPFETFRETLFPVSASRGTPSAALLTPNAALLTPNAALFTPSASVVTTSAALGAPSGGARGTSHGSRRSSCVADGSERVDRGNDRRGRRSSGGDRRDERVDRRAERGSRAQFRGAECAGCGALNPNDMASRGVARCATLADARAAWHTDR